MLIYNYHAVFTARDIVMEPSYDGALLHALRQDIMVLQLLFWLCVTNAMEASFSCVLLCPLSREVTHTHGKRKSYGKVCCLL